MKDVRRVMFLEAVRAASRQDYCFLNSFRKLLFTIEHWFHDFFWIAVFEKLAICSYVGNLWLAN